MKRRSLLTLLAASLLAPAVVRSTSIMPVRLIRFSPLQLVDTTTGRQFDVSAAPGDDLFLNMSKVLFAHHRDGMAAEFRMTREVRDALGRAVIGNGTTLMFSRKNDVMGTPIPEIYLSIPCVVLRA